MIEGFEKLGILFNPERFRDEIEQKSNFAKAYDNRMPACALLM